MTYGQTVKRVTLGVALGVLLQGAEYGDAIPSLSIQVPAVGYVNIVGTSGGILWGGEWYNGHGSPVPRTVQAARLEEDEAIAEVPHNLLALLEAAGVKARTYGDWPETLNGGIVWHVFGQDGSADPDDSDCGYETWPRETVGFFCGD